MITCCRRGCQTPDVGVERWTHNIYLCLPHRRMLLGQAKEHEQRMAAKAKVVDKEVHEVAVQDAGWAYPQQYKLTHRGNVRECSGGLPSLGKDQ